MKDNHVVMLQGPTGHMWEVELSPNTHNTLEIRHGWKEFANFYSLEMGDFLVFNYVGVASSFEFVSSTILQIIYKLNVQILTTIHSSCQYL